MKKKKKRKKKRWTTFKLNLNKKKKVYYLRIYVPGPSGRHLAFIFTFRFVE